MTGTYREAVVAVYVIDAGLSRFTVRGYAGGLLSGLGHNPVIAIRDFAGEAQWDPLKPDYAALRLRIRAAGLSIENDINDKDRREMERVMREEVLETDRFPEIVFESISASAVPGGRIHVEGNLTLHGMTRRERISTQVAVTSDILRAFGNFAIMQTNYCITLAAVAGGVLKLKDELKFNFDIVARRRTE